MSWDGLGWDGVVGWDGVSWDGGWDRWDECGGMGFGEVEQRHDWPCVWALPYTRHAPPGIVLLLPVILREDAGHY